MTGDEIQTVKDSINIVEVIGDHVKLKKHGSEYIGLCPFHNEKTPSFNVSPSGQFYKCFGCGASGDVFSFLERQENKGFVTVVKELAAKYNIELSDGSKKEYKIPVPRLQKVSDKIINYFESRGISNNTLLRFGITESIEWMPQFGKEMNVICFNFIREGICTNIKFRSGNKAFKLEKDAELIFYNLDAIKDLETVTIVEGEIDALSCYEAGIHDCVSVPNGAGVSKQNLQYVDNCISYFENKKRIVIFTDNDANGKNLRDELIRRFGYEKCFVVQYPSGCKDANEILTKRGKDVLKSVVDLADPLPVEGVFTGLDLSDDVFRFYDNGYPNGYKVIMPGMDDYVKLQLMLGQFTAVTGIPGHGKSEWVDWLMVLMSKHHGWKWAIVSPENQPSSIHMIKLIQKYYGKAFDKRHNALDRIPKERLFECISFINDHFYFINVDVTKMTLDGILSKIEELIYQKGVKGWLLDPWNKVEQKLDFGVSETQAINIALTQISSFCKKRQVHGIVIAHPSKVPKDSKGKFVIPNMYSISGSAHWNNQMDNGITVYRDNEKGTTVVFIQKVRYDWLGNIGHIEYIFNRNTRQYQLADGSNMESGADGNFFTKSEIIKFDSESEKEDPF